MLDLPLPSQPQGITAPSPVPNYTAWWQRHMHVNNLPKVVTWKRNGQDSNLRPFESQVQRSNHYTTRPHMLLLTTDKPVLHYQGHCASYHSEWLFATTEEQTTNSAAYCQQSTCTDQAGVQSAVSSLGWWCCCLWLINTWQPQQTTVINAWRSCDFSWLVVMVAALWAHVQAAGWSLRGTLVTYQWWGYSAQTPPRRARQHHTGNGQ